jgi:hypothetical protein
MDSHNKLIFLLITFLLTYTEVNLNGGDVLSDLYLIGQNNLGAVPWQSKLSCIPPAWCSDNIGNSGTDSAFDVFTGATISHYSRLVPSQPVGPISSPRWILGESGTFIPPSHSRVNSQSPINFDQDKVPGGPKPYYDIRDYGAYAKFSTTTCTTISGSPSITLGSASNFKNGEYATCYNAGSTTTVSAQTTPVIIPSVNAGGMSSTASTGGTNSNCYEIVGEDQYNGRSAASSAGCTSTAITPGQQAFTITKASRSNQTVTLTTSARHDFVPGQLIFVYGLTDPTFNGWYLTVSPTSRTTITYGSGWDTRNGASTTTTVGTATVTGWWMNKVSWAHDTTSFRHHIYGPNCPTACNWMGQTVLDYWYDFGTLMESHQAQPPYIPTGAPSSAANQHFTFQISSGGGTTTLTAATNAGASVSGAGIVSDAGPAIYAAAVASHLPPYGYGATDVVVPHISARSYVVNSFTDICSTYSQGVPRLVLQGSGLTLNQPLCSTHIKGEASGGGTNPDFGFGTIEFLSGIGYPQLYFHVSGTRMEDVGVEYSALNGGLGMWATNPVNYRFDNTYWLSSNGSPYDFVSQSAIFQSTNSGGFDNQFDRIVISSNQANSFFGNTSSPVPLFLFTGSSYYGTNLPGSVFFHDAWFIQRGSVDLDGTHGSGGGSIVMDHIWAQNGVEPIVQISGKATNLQDAVISNSSIADYPTPWVANYGNMGGVIFKNVSPPSTAFNMIMGNPVASVESMYSTSSQLGTNSNVHNVTNGAISNPTLGVNGVNIGLQQFNEDISLGNNYGFFAGGNSTPPAPTCIGFGSGSSFSAGTYYTFYAPVWQNGAVGQLSLISAACTITPGEEIQVTIPAAISGAEGYVLYYNTSGNSGGYMLGASNCSVPTSTSLTINGTTNCGPRSPQFSGGGPAGIQNGTVFAQTLALGPTIAPTGVTSGTRLYMDRTAKWPSFKANGNTPYVIPGISGSIVNGHNICASGTNGAYVDCLTPKTIASGTSILGTSPISAKTCATVVTSSAAGVDATDVISYSFNAAPSGAYTAGLFIQSYVTPGNVSFLVCNPTASSLTPPAAALNWRVNR